MYPTARHVYTLVEAARRGDRDIVSQLLDQGASVDTVASRTTALIAATQTQREDIVLLLLDRGANVNMVVNNTTALTMAVTKGHKAIMSLLLDRGADVNLAVNNTTPLITACEAPWQHWDTGIVSLLLDRGADVDKVANDHKYVPKVLIAAAWGGHLDIMQRLVDRGVDVNMVVNNTTTLIVAAQRGHLDIMSLLLDRGVDANMVVNDTTALITATKWKHEHILSLLLDRGADVDMVVHDHNTTALVAAVKRGEQAMVSMLLDKGADVNMVAGAHDIDTTALVAAVENEHEDIVLMLMDKGADVNMVVHDTTALVVAVERKKQASAMVSILLEKGADVHMVVHDTTALVAAAEKGHKDIVSLLLGRGAAVNLVVHDTTALVAAVEKGHKDTVLMLMDKGADVNIVVHDTTALVAAVEKGHKNIVSILIDKGADVNIVVHDTTALVAAAEKGYRNIMSLLLEKRADVNMVVHDTTALVATVERGKEAMAMVSMLLEKGADVNMVVHDTTALVAAAEKGHKDIVSLLLGRGAAVNLAVHTTALIAAIAAYTEKGHASFEIVRLLLDAGADLNIIAGQYGTALIAAICVCHDTDHSLTSNLDKVQQSQPQLLSMLLNHNPDVSIVAGVHGTALIAAISKLQFPEQANHNQGERRPEKASNDLPKKKKKKHNHLVVSDLGPVESSGWQWVFLDRLLSSGSLTQDHINITVGEHGTALAVAISTGNLQLLHRLAASGGDVNRVGDSCGIALRAALAEGWDSQRLYDIFQYLVGEGADINVVSSQRFGHGSPLGQAAYMGDTRLVSLLLRCGADPFHVGGMYNRTALSGAYPNALDAALSPGSKAQADLVAILSNAMKCSGIFSELQRSPPFPMPYTRSTLKTKIASGSSTCSDLDEIYDLPVALAAQHADISCAILKEELIVKVLVQLVIGTDTEAPGFKLYENWIRNDVRYFVTQGYDLGEAYAAARVGWKHFNKSEFVNLVAQHRGQWLGIAQEIDKERVNSIYIYQDKTGTMPVANINTVQEVIKRPYKVMPRRLWDLKSNRVVEFRMLQSELLAYKSTTEQRFGKARAKLQGEVDGPVFWAISHSWESRMDPVETPINQFQWPVPLPHGLNLECNVRQELLNYGIEYVWLDVLCLRQNAVSRPAGSNEFEAKKRDEWKLDVPTIGNVYRVAQGIVRYFNGLGRPFSPEGWDSDRHWLRRAWTLQEIKTENSTINGGIHRGRGSTGSISNIMNIYGMMVGQTMTLRRAIQLVLKLAEDADSQNGCSLYALVREMSQRKATQNTDKVAGLVYLLRLTQLPTYDGDAKENDVWARCFHMLPLARKIELLFDFPYRSAKQHWFPTWSELMTWPEVNSDCGYSPARRPDREGPEIQDFVDLTESKEVSTGGSLLISDIWALSQCHVTRNLVDYEVEVKTKVYGFYGPYVSQNPIDITPLSGQQREFTIATADLRNSSNWVVCEVVKKLKVRCKEKEACESGKDLRQSSEIEVEVLRKVGVLRTDFCGEMLAGVSTGDGAALRRIHALFV